MSRIVLSALLVIGLSACSNESGKSQQNTVESNPEAKTEIINEEPVANTDLAPLRKNQKMARCIIGPDRYEGPCVFQTLGKGSFAVSMKDQSPIHAEVSLITVNIVAKNKAEVFGLTTFGNNSRWGSATRSGEDRACWEGSDFLVCAY